MDATTADTVLAIVIMKYFNGVCLNVLKLSLIRKEVQPYRRVNICRTKRSILTPNNVKSG